jgi:hypothetical protein
MGRHGRNMGFRRPGQWAAFCIPSSICTTCFATSWGLEIAWCELAAAKSHLSGLGSWEDMFYAFVFVLSLIETVVPYSLVGFFCFFGY